MRVLSILFFVLAFVHSSYAKNQEFPGRDLYLDVKHIEMADLAKEYNNSIIVDVRSKYEFDTLHIKSASHVSLRSPEFISSMQQLRKQYPHKKIVTYCNGKTCMKSYKAARKCQQHGVRNVYAFDAGIMDWAKNQPNRSVSGEAVTQAFNRMGLIAPERSFIHVDFAPVVVQGHIEIGPNIAIVKYAPTD